MKEEKKKEVTRNSMNVKIKDLLSCLCAYCALAVLVLSVSSFISMIVYTSDYSKLFSLDSDVLRAIVWAVFALLFASFFTALSITLNKPSVSILAYFRFQKGIEQGIDFGAIVFFVIWSFFIQYGTCSVIDSVLYIHGLVLFALSFIESISAMHVISDKGEIVESFIKKVNRTIKLLGFNESYEEGSLPNPFLYDSYCNFCVKCLNSIDGPHVKHNIYSVINECLNYLDVENMSLFLSFFIAMRNNEIFKCDERINTDQDFGFYEKCLLLSAMSKSFIGTNFEGVLQIYLDHYRDWTLKRVLDKSHILTIRDAFLAHYKEFYKLSEERRKQLQTVLYRCRTIIQYSIFYCDKDVLENLLNDYCQLVQFLNYDEHDVLSCFYDNATEISIWIIACSSANKLKNKEDFGYIVFPLINNHVFQINPREISFDLYPVVLPRTDYHVEHFSYDYFFSVFLVYICAVILRDARMHSQDEGNGNKSIEDFIDERILHKDDLCEKYDICQTLLRWVDEISEDDYYIIGNISIAESKASKIAIEEILNERSKTLRIIIQNNLIPRTNFEEKRREIEKQFNDLGIKSEQDAPGPEITIKSNIILSARKSVNTIYYSQVLLEYIISRFDQLFDIEVKEGKRIDISFENLLLKFNEKSNSLIVPADVYNLIYEREIPGIKYSGTGIIYHSDGENRAVSLRVSDVSFVYNEKEVLNSLMIKKISFDSENKQEIEDTADLSVPVYICFACDFSKISSRYFITDLLK